MELESIREAMSKLTDEQAVDHTLGRLESVIGFVGDHQAGEVRAILIDLAASRRPLPWEAS